MLAGLNSDHAPNVDINESLSTLWYHDSPGRFHLAEHLQGSGGILPAVHQFDTGDETTGFRLPSFPQFDIRWHSPTSLRPRLLARWLSTLFNLDGVPGDKFLANGKIQPFFNVESRRYTKDLGASVIAVLELNGDLSMIVNKVSIREAMTLPPRNADER